MLETNFIKKLRKIIPLDNVKKLLVGIDKAFIFPALCVIVALIIYGYIKEGIAVVGGIFVLSVLHNLFLGIYPYLNNSPYYRYLAQVEKHNVDNQKVKSFFGANTLRRAKNLLFGSLVLSTIIPECSEFLAIIYFYAFGVYSIETTIEMVNIWGTPRLPEKVRICDPFYMQKRYMPFNIVVENLTTKFLPLCSRVLKLAGSGLGLAYMGTKYFEGFSEIDPFRQKFLNYYHGFPYNHIWDESDLVLYSHYKKMALEETPNLTVEELNEKFIEKKGEIRKAYAGSINIPFGFEKKTGP